MTTIRDMERLEQYQGRRAKFEDDFLQGQRDCKEGTPGRKETEGYLRGWEAQSEHEYNMRQLGLRP